jgi:dTDP-4-amino-4,6-dideoxygalactose transaminase
MLSNFSKHSQIMEQSAKAYFNSDRHFHSAVSCDISLILLLKCFDFPAGSEVLVPSFTFNSTVNGILWNGLKPVFVDIDPDGYGISLEDIGRKITRKTVAIMGVHIFGNPCKMTELEAIADAKGLKLIFDSAHAYGSKYAGKHICEYGDAGAFSFSGTKLITSAEGGLVYIKDKEISDKFVRARNYGFLNDYNTKMLGLNGKISEFHAAIAHLAMRDIDNIMSRRQVIAKRYAEGIKNVEFQTVKPDNLSSYKDFSIAVDKRDELYDYLTERGIQTKKYFFPNHYTDFHKTSGGLENTEALYAKILCIPIFNDITEEQVEYVIDSINSFGAKS